MSALAAGPGPAEALCDLQGKRSTQRLQVLDTSHAERAHTPGVLQVSLGSSWDPLQATCAKGKQGGRQDENVATDGQGGPHVSNLAHTWPTWGS